MIVNLLENKLAMWFVCEAIGSQHELIDQFDKNENCEHDIRFSVDGVELNFEKVINAIKANYDRAVYAKAREIYLSRLEERTIDIECELNEILDRLRIIRETKFPELNS